MADYLGEGPRRGFDNWIMPIMKDFYPAIAIMVPPGRSRENCEELLLRLSADLARGR